jgi:hypothetical protein
VDEPAIRQPRGQPLAGHYVKRVFGNLAAYSAVYGQPEPRLPDQVPGVVLDNISF